MSSLWTLRRSTTDAKLAGLCGALAERWRIDPVLVRVAFALLALSGGVGLVLYAAGWLLLPVQGRDRAPVEDLFGETVGRWPRQAWTALVVVACVAVFVVFGALTPFGMSPALVLAAIWYFGFYRRRARIRRNRMSQPAARPPFPPPIAGHFQHVQPPPPLQGLPPGWTPYASPAQPAARGWIPYATTAYAPTYAPVASPTPSPVPAPPPLDPEVAERAAFFAVADPVGLYTEPVAARPLAPRPASERVSARRLRLVSVLALGLSTFGLGLANYLGAPIPWTAYAAVALLVIGLTLVAATWFGRPRGLLPVSLVLALAVLASTVAGPASGLDRWGMARHSYQTLAQLPPGGDSVGGGQLLVDLSRLQVTSDAAYRAHVDLGNLEVVAPPNARLLVHYRVGAGQAQVLTTPAAPGQNLSGTIEPGTPTGQPTLTLDLSVDRGRLDVHR